MTPRRVPQHIGFVSRAPSQTRAFGARLGRVLRAGDVLLLSGQLGAGKTTLVQGLVAGAGAGHRVTSPSFTLINEYRGEFAIHHVDLFRLEQLDREIEEAIESAADVGSVVVEWPDLLPVDLRVGALRVDFEVIGDSERSILVHAEGSRWAPEDLREMMEDALRDGAEGSPE